MKKLIAALALVALLGSGPLCAQNYKRHVKGAEVLKRTTTVVEEEQWSDSLDALMARAKAEKKLIFWLQLVGDLGGKL